MTSEAWDAAEIAVAWAATYALHSTILLLAAYLLERRLSDRPEIMSPVWKFAVLAGLVTASVQVGVGVEPLAGRIELAIADDVHDLEDSSDVRAAVVPEARAAAVVHAPVAPPAEPLQSGSVVAPSEPAPRAASVPIDVDQDAARTPMVSAYGGTRSIAPAAAPPWSAFVALGWLAIAGLGLSRLIAAARALRHELRARESLAAGELRRTLDELRQVGGVAAPVALSTSRTVAVPFAVGVLRPEIVVPSWTVGDLSPTALRTMLAHELAHVVRRDPLWRVVMATLVNLVPFQPLLRVAERRITQHAEYLSDAWAARHTCEPIALAHCLTEIAGRLGGVPLAFASTMAEPRSILGRRVMRLLEPRRDRRLARPVSWALGLASLLTLVLVAPGVGRADDRGARRMRAFTAPHHGMYISVEDTARSGPERSGPGPRRVVTVVQADDAPAATSSSPAATRKARRAARRERAATDRELRRVIRHARREGRVPRLDELASVLGDPGGSAVTIVVDGQTARIDPHTAEVIRDVLESVDVDEIAEAAAEAALDARDDEDDEDDEDEVDHRQAALEAEADALAEAARALAEEQHELADESAREALREAARDAAERSREIRRQLHRRSQGRVHVMPAPPRSPLEHVDATQARGRWDAFVVANQPAPAPMPAPTPSDTCGDAAPRVVPVPRVRVPAAPVAPPPPRSIRVAPRAPRPPHPPVAPAPPAPPLEYVMLAPPAP